MLITTLVVSLNSFGQEIRTQNPNYTLRGGFTLSFGTHTNRLGAFTGAYYRIGNIELNSRIDLKYALLMLGPKLKGVESLMSFGVRSGFIQEDQIFESFSRESNLLRNYRYSLGYSINFYLNDMRSGQRTGSINLRLRKIEIVHENDILAEVASDKFRTAALGVYYNDSLNIIGIENTLWTGNKDDENARKVYNQEFARYGYIDLSRTLYGKNSHGILNVSIKRDLGFGMLLDSKLGIDHEKIRNTVQNKFMHDLKFWPDKWNKAKNLHIPMLDKNGNAFTYREGQSLKSGSIFFQLNLNSEKFY